MSYARVAAMYITAYCKATFKDWEGMPSTVCSGSMLDAFDIVGTGSHKYIPADKLSADLGLEPGAGVYSYAKFSDGTYLLFTCPGAVAYWSGNDEDKAIWAELRKEPI